MTDPTKAARRVAALTLIPASVAVFGAGLAWANSHDPNAASSSGSSGQATDPQLAAARAKVDDAQAKLAKLQAEVDARNADAASQSAAAAAAATVSASTPPPPPTAVGGTTAAAKATAAAAKAAPAQPKVAAAPKAVVAAPPPPAPVVQTQTKASGKP